MIADLPDTTTTDVSKALVTLRHSVGAMAMGRVLTLLVSTDQAGADDALACANEATRQHPARIVVVVQDDGRADRVDAQIRVGGDAGASEIVVLRLHGSLREHADSVVTPLLLPDSPIVGWWPGDPPGDVAGSILGLLCTRRITDATRCRHPVIQLERRAAHYRPGDSDLAWTRITRWRALLAAALDYPPYQPVTEVMVTSEPDCPGADLLSGWLASSLGTPVHRARSRAGSGLVSVRLQRTAGPVDLVRRDAQVASLSQPGQPTREVALLEPSLPEALAAELHRLDPDEIYASALVTGLPLVQPAESTQQEEIRRGRAPVASDASSQQQASSDMSSSAVRDRDPEAGSPAPDALRAKVDEGLADVAAQFRSTQIFPAKDDVCRAVAEATVQHLEEAVIARGRAHLVLTGGSMGIAAVQALADLSAGRDVWQDVHVWWGDERFVPQGDADRNDTQADEAGLGRLGVPAEQVHRVAHGSDVEALPRAAADYATQLAAQAGAPRQGDSMAVAVPRFDVLMLGVGPDSHVASLFPGRDELSVRDRATVAVTESPKPPPLRVSLTLPALLQARATWLLVGGKDKADAVAASIATSDDPGHPASWVRGTEDTTWWLDEEAAAQLRK
ncbi:MAG: 6-phosphogluconolactonase [Actinobacteria bacterium]|nr:6-phosphogluconolactonase [Actinomycetota bacterium]